MPGPMRKINRTRSVARNRPYGGGRSATPMPRLSDTPKKGGVSKGARPTLPKPGIGFTRPGFPGNKPKPTGRPGLKRKPTPAATTNRKRTY